MSVFLFLEKENEQKARVMCIHNFPDMLTDEEKRGGVLIDSYNEPTLQTGKTALPYWNYETQELFFEYVDAPLNDIEQLQKQVEAQAQTIATQEQAIAELTTIVAMNYK